MEGFPLLAVLAFATLIIVAVVAYTSKRKTEDRLHDDHAPHSSLAADRPREDLKPDSRKIEARHTI